MSKKTIVFDFDGVIHKGYTGWKDGSIYGEIDYTLLWYMKDLMSDYYIVISSNRPAKQIVDFLNSDPNNPLDFEVFDKDMDNNMYWNKDGVVGVTNGKAVGVLYIDDRGYKYKNASDLKNNLNFILNGYERECCDCGATWYDEYYLFNDKMLCNNCLLEALECEGNLTSESKTVYYTSDWHELGTTADMDTTLSNICERFNIRKISK